MTALTFGIYYAPDIMRLTYKNEIIIIFLSSFHSQSEPLSCHSLFYNMAYIFEVGKLHLKEIETQSSHGIIHT